STEWRRPPRPGESSSYSVGSRSSETGNTKGEYHKPYVQPHGRANPTWPPQNARPWEFCGNCYTCLDNIHLWFHYVDQAFKAALIPRRCHLHCVKRYLTGSAFRLWATGDWDSWPAFVAEFTFIYMRKFNNYFHE
ncbi:unnamed protein product, partial [Allacma fusca]